MPAPEREARPQPTQPEPPSVSAVSMKDLLAAGAAASAVSTPPRDEPADEGDTEDAGRDAA
ncbi:hypothetical protein [Streptomyces sp. NPDC056796]|uniref:hypothetical protein n=1 Tax=unclassified Streptomyces TaxID=2593676 RepID=UPI0036C752E8